MKILVVGADALGSQLTHTLYRAGNDVTLLARGKRLAELQANGLVIRHYVQMKTTIDPINLTDHFGPEDAYDLVFVVMQCQQLDEFLPVLCANTGTTNFVLVGNNGTADKTDVYIREHSRMERHVVFGFQGSGGRRENGRVKSVHTGFSTDSGSMTLGGLNGDSTLYTLLEKVFTHTHYRLSLCADMDAWLKCHAAFILPIVFACYYSDGDLRKVSRETVILNKILDAVEDGYQIVKAAGYPIMPPEDEGFLQRNRSKVYWM